MIMFSIALLMFSAFFTVFSQRQISAGNLQNQRTAASIADKVAFELDLALTEGSGFSRTFELRDSIGGNPYTVTLHQGTVLLEYGEKDVLSSSAAKNITGTVQPGTNTVTNNGGTLYVTQP